MSFTPTTAPFHLKKNPLFLLAVIALFFLVGTGAFVIGRNSSRNEEPVADLVELSREEQLQQELEERKREFEDRIREAVDRQREASDRQREAMDRAREAAERAGELGPAAAPGNIKAVDLASYEYPNASVGRSIRIPGNEMLSLQTGDIFEKVSEFYQKKLGTPLILINEDDEKTALYQSTGSPAIAVLIKNDEDHPGRIIITVLRSPFPGISVEPPIAPPPPAPPATKPEG
jgi:hypothetical protein